jgi:hypothetical protein
MHSDWALLVQTVDAVVIDFLDGEEGESQPPSETMAATVLSWFIYVSLSKPVFGQLPAKTEEIWTQYPIYAVFWKYTDDGIYPKRAR